MDFFRNHWYDVGGVLAAGSGAVLLTGASGVLSWLLWANLTALFLHQLEEYRFPGYFPGVINTVLFSSERPDRFPLNTNSSLIINTSGWVVYFLAAVLAEQALWLGIAAVVASVGNVVVHTFIFNLKGRTRCNPGMLTSLFLFLPISVVFFYWIIRRGQATATDWAVGLVLGFVLSVGLVALIRLLKNEETGYVFPKRSLR
jgi:hypothetical protein